MSLTQTGGPTELVLWAGLGEGFSTAGLLSTITVLLLGLIGLIRGGPLMVRQLRGIEEYSPHREPPWWPLGDQLWRGIERGEQFVGLVAVPLFVIAGSSFLIFGIAGPHSGEVRVLFFGIFAWLLLGTVGVLSCILFNRPKFLVVPSMREEPGAVAVWLARDRERGRRLAHIALPSALVLFVAGWTLWNPVSARLGAILVLSATMLFLEVGRQLDADPEESGTARS